MSGALINFNTLAIGSPLHSKWYEFQLELSDVAKVKEYGYFFVRINPYGASAHGCEWYLDDIEIVDCGFDGTLDMVYKNTNPLINKDTNGTHGWSSFKDWAIEYNNVPKSENKALRVTTERGETINVAIHLGDDFINSISVRDKIAFRMYIQKGTCDATAFKIGFGVTKLKMNLNGDYLDQETDKWLDFEFEMTEELLTAYKTSKALIVGINQHQATSGHYEANYFFDSFKVVKAN
ncbi:MAG: hypothetical protein IJX88_03515 [Clostridia bacterium]|nr:hypothetical protein [Clostridia bacterium]